MGELRHLASELDRHETVTEVTEMNAGPGVKFNIRNGEYKSLSSEVTSILGRYDVSVTPVFGEWDYFAPAP